MRKYLQSEIVANDWVGELNISDPVIRTNLYRHVLHGLKLKYGEYPRLPRKFKKKHPEYANRIKTRKRSVINSDQTN